MDERKFYNAAAIALKGNYKKLKKLKDSYGSWKAAWKNIDGAQNPDQEYARLEKIGIKIILLEDSSYPELLKQIPFPPLALYVLGNLGYTEPAVAIIGTRMPTPQGKELAGIFSGKLSSAGIPIISGLALGIDAEAHKGALENSGKTIAVLGTPLDNIYPRQNSRIADDILESGGAIISEFALGHPYNPANFLARNRIVSGLSNGILIIEAPERSGSLATAKFALEQNREIFVIPGNTSSSNYKGSNALLKSGANLVTEPDDILQYFNISPEKISSTDQSISEHDKMILDIIKKLDGRATIDNIMKSADLDVPELNKTLALLTIKGIIKELNGKYFLNS